MSVIPQTAARKRTSPMSESGQEPSSQLNAVRKRPPTEAAPDGTPVSILESLIAATPPGFGGAPAVVCHHLHALGVVVSKGFVALDSRKGRPGRGRAFVTDLNLGIAWFRNRLARRGIRRRDCQTEGKQEQRDPHHFLPLSRACIEREASRCISRISASDRFEIFHVGPAGRHITLQNRMSLASPVGYCGVYGKFGSYSRRRR